MVQYAKMVTCTVIIDGQDSGRDNQIYLNELKSSEKDALESMRQSESFVPNLSREDKNLFDKMKENFWNLWKFCQKSLQIKK